MPSARTVEILNEAGYPLFTERAGLRPHVARDGGLPAAARAFVAADRDDRGAASRRAKVAAMLAQSGPVLCEYRARPLACRPMASAPTMRGELAHSRDEAVAAAQAIGRPVALKVQSADIPHKTEAGAVALNLTGADAVRAAYDRVLAAAKRHAPTAHIDGVLVQPMAPPGREVILGINRDPTWGLLLMVGLGGVLVETLGDVALAPVPLDHAAARALLGRLKARRCSVLIAARRRRTPRRSPT